ncbi:hypothetical protein WN944_007727 [Citrus x changshan-huyou]|uniref:Uncharacterized protein n=1 Tax=Citrus x changshan-huyou TaxID=2935761 RepID=A0AAP0MRC8_9ROSI
MARTSTSERWKLGGGRPGIQYRAEIFNVDAVGEIQEEIVKRVENVDFGGSWILQVVDAYFILSQFPLKLCAILNEKMGVAVNGHRRMFAT